MYKCNCLGIKEGENFTDEQVAKIKNNETCGRCKVYLQSMVVLATPADNYIEFWCNGQLMQTVGINIHACN